MKRLTLLLAGCGVILLAGCWENSAAQSLALTEYDRSVDSVRTLTLQERAEENFILTKSKYAAGAALALEVLAAQQMLTESHLAEIQTLADIRSLNARIERLNAH